MVDLVWLESVLAGAVQAGTVYLIASLGEVYAERSGVLNLGLEGMMILGAAVSFIFANAFGHGLALLATLLIGLLFGLLLAFLSVTLRLNQIVVGLALTLLGLGLSGFITSAEIRKRILLSLNPEINQQALLTQQAPNLPIIKIPYLSDIPLVGKILFSQNILVYTALILAFVMWFVLFKTRFGLSLRSVGENPAMADAMGVNVYLMRYVAVMIGGMLGALAGAYLFIGYQPFWVEGMTSGRGFISLALVILAMWSPLRAILGAFLFGGVEVLQFRLQLIGVGAQTPQFILMLPYAVTIITLTLLSVESMKKRIGVPAALTIPYSRE
ncbi:MAG TPA: ABC transporter permease [Candidatus Caldiarchaeum subterraneum]|uniref:ABC transporter permease n=1 Tax=Caldiarchaeum subterraneum TaxID=311458 RepID=A0A832ZV16_CALS0|nr:ABC transporter permease [Aigarchaeota archaeon]HIQ29454.1 ABC transporter permease [Candidatus Caldarchaeum subterraneum]